MRDLPTYRGYKKLEMSPEEHDEYLMQEILNEYLPKERHKKRHHTPDKETTE